MVRREWIETVMGSTAVAERAQIMSERAVRQLGSGASDGDLGWFVRSAAWDWWRETPATTAAEAREVIRLAQAIMDRRQR